MTDDKVAVTQAARDAAAPVMRWLYCDHGAEQERIFTEQMNEGDNDDHFVVQAFARFEAQARLAGERAAREQIINAPETADFMAGVPIEAAHQRERWGADHDAGKAPLDWFWLIGYLSQKAATSAMNGDTEKALHHTISTAAALANWHAALSGNDTSMRPGIALPRNDVAEDWTCDPCDASNLGIRQVCRFCKKPRSQVARPAIRKEAASITRGEN